MIFITNSPFLILMVFDGLEMVLIVDISENIPEEELCSSTEIDGL